jgi:hypothetical protein
MADPTNVSAANDPTILWIGAGELLLEEAMNYSNGLDRCRGALRRR